MALIKYNGSEFLFNNPNFKSECVIDYDFKKYLDAMNGIAKKHSLKIFITSSFRLNSDNLKGAIVKPATKSNHFVGHAIDCNLWEEGRIFAPNSDNPIHTKFITDCKESGLRWGGDFGIKGGKSFDPVHFDDGLNIRNPDLWNKKYAELRQ